jgi:type 1 glutamine amidotransferase
VKASLLFLLATMLAGLKPAADEPSRPIRALLVVGGCCHDYPTQKEILIRGLSQRAHIVWTVSYDPDTSTQHKNPIYDRPDWSKNFDVVVHDECSSYVSDPKIIENILEPHRNGLAGVVLHCGMHSYRTEGWDKNVATPWMKFTGVISTGHGPQVPIAVRFLDSGHAITRGLADWMTVDEELYNNASGQLESSAHALAQGTQIFTESSGNDVTKGRKNQVTAQAMVAWTNMYLGKTRVFATTLGHNNQTVADTRYLDLVARGLLWSVGKPDAEHVKTAK